MAAAKTNSGIQRRRGSRFCPESIAQATKANGATNQGGCLSAHARPKKSAASHGFEFQKRAQSATGSTQTMSVIEPSV